MPERLTRRDMLKIAGVAALGSALGTASVGGGLLYFSRSEPQPVRPVLAKPEYAPPPPAPVAKAEPAPLPLPAKPIDKPVVAAIPTRTAESIPSVPASKNELVIDTGISSRTGRIDWGMVFHPGTFLTVYLPLGVPTLFILSRIFAPKGGDRCASVGCDGDHSG